MSTDLIILVLGISLLLYVLLGGADFGAGIVEIFTGKKGIKTISGAIAPVWEANHIWLILAVVILFNGFPLVYTTITTYLHIPLMILLLGITVRGTAFTFRYYDIKDQTQWYYTLLFRISSVLTSVFLGVILGAVLLGEISTDPSSGFYNLFMKPWLNIFSLSTGIFTGLLFAWLAVTYLLGESENADDLRVFRQINLTLFILLFLNGIGIFLLAEHYDVFLFKKFVRSAVGLSCVVTATLLIPLFWYALKKRSVLWSRVFAGTITSCIFTGWFAVQFPVMVYVKEGVHLTVSSTKAPDSTLYYLLYALAVGILIIFPAFAYLFRIFKFSNKNTQGS